jgi:Helix-turn-helix domain
MDRAARLFRFEERASDSPFVEKIWRTRSEPAAAFLSVALARWELVVTRQPGRTYLTVRGPETRATTVAIPPEAEFLGVQFRLGVFMPGLPLGRLVDRSITLPEAGGASFWLRGAAWEYPAFDDAEGFVRRLVRQGLLVRDPVVGDALAGHAPGRSLRAVQRRARRATGLTPGAVRQIERAQAAVELLDRGVPILETVHRLAYADQAHLTRSLRRFAGQTPAQILRGRRSR